MTTRSAINSLQDCNNHTAYDLAVLHGHHECARLLKALHWANQQDADFRQQLAMEHMQQQYEREAVALEECLKREAADMAYDEWLKQKSESSKTRVPPPPQECLKRREIRDKNNTAVMCKSCSLTAAQSRSSLATASKGKSISSSFKISLHQAKRNTIAVGKPEKLYPYTNYPPQCLRSGKSTHHVSDGVDSKSGRSSRMSAAPKRHTPTPTSLSKVYNQPLSVPCTIRRRPSAHSKSKPRRAASAGMKGNISSNLTLAASSMEHGNEMGKSTADTTENDTQTGAGGYMCHDTFHAFYKEDMPESRPVEILHSNSDSLAFSLAFGSKMNGEYLWRGDKRERAAGTWEREREEEEFMDDLGFHDVGYENSLDSLSLPPALTREKTPAEVMQLLRCLGGRPSHPLMHRSQSYTGARGSKVAGRFQRRFSLGAIPEGQMVTNYSDEDVSSTQLISDLYLDMAAVGSVDRKSDIMIESEAAAENNDNVMWSIGDEMDSNSNSSSSSDESILPLNFSHSNTDIKSTSSATTLHKEDSPDQSTSLYKRTSASDSLLLEKEHQLKPVQLCTSPSALLRKDPSHSLKIVTLAWDVESKSVKTELTLSPMSPSPSSSHKLQSVEITGKRSPRSPVEEAKLSRSSGLSSLSPSPLTSLRFSPPPPSLDTSKSNPSDHTLNGLSDPIESLRSHEHNYCDSTLKQTFRSGLPGELTPQVASLTATDEVIEEFHSQSPCNSRSMPELPSNSPLAQDLTSKSTVLSSGIAEQSKQRPRPARQRTPFTAPHKVGWTAVKSTTFDFNEL